MIPDKSLYTACCPAVYCFQCQLGSTYERQGRSLVFSLLLHRTGQCDKHGRSRCYFTSADRCLSVTKKRPVHTTRPKHRIHSMSYALQPDQHQHCALLVQVTSLFQPPSSCILQCLTAVTLTWPAPHGCSVIINEKQAVAVVSRCRTGVGGSCCMSKILTRWPVVNNAAAILCTTACFVFI